MDNETVTSTYIYFSFLEFFLNIVLKSNLKTNFDDILKPQTIIESITRQAIYIGKNCTLGFHLS